MKAGSHLGLVSLGTDAKVNKVALLLGRKVKSFTHGPGVLVVKWLNNSTIGKVLALYVADPSLNLSIS